MLRVMIVDDEPDHREGLTNLVPWHKYGCEVIHTAEDGEEALWLSNRDLVDILVADICMPDMDGVELAQRMRRRFPNLNVILVTGIEEFEYARTAIEVGVSAYLLKPLNPADLCRCLDKIQRDQQLKAELRIQEERLRGQLATCMPLARGRFLQQLLEGVILDEHEAAVRAAGMGLGFETLSLVVCVLVSGGHLQSGHPGSQDGVLLIPRLETVLDLVSAAEGLQYIWTPIGSESLALLIPLCGDRAVLDDHLVQILQTMQEQYSVVLTAGVGNPTVCWVDSRRSYYEAQHALTHRSVVGKGSIIQRVTPVGMAGCRISSSKTHRYV